MLPVLESGESCISEWLLDASVWVCRLWRLRDCSSAVVWMSAALGSVSQQRRGEEPGLTSSAWGCKSLLFMFWGKNKPFQSSSEKPTLSIGVHRTHTGICFARLSSASLSQAFLLKLANFVWLRIQFACTSFCTSVYNRMVWRDSLSKNENGLF